MEPSLNQQLRQPFHHRPPAHLRHGRLFAIDHAPGDRLFGNWLFGSWLLGCWLFGCLFFCCGCSSRGRLPLHSQTSSAAFAAATPLGESEDIETPLAPAASHNSTEPSALAIVTIPEAQVAYPSPQAEAMEAQPKASNARLEATPATSSGQPAWVAPNPMVTEATANSADALPDPPQINKLRLRITGVRVGRGLVKVALFHQPTSFPDSSAASRTLELDSQQSVLECAIDLSQALAIAVYQDIDGNGQLTQNRRGIPLEPFGFSNNARGERGPPTFSDACLAWSAEAGASELLTQIDLP